MRINGSASEGIGRSIRRASNRIENSFSKLASGSRITKAADDASGLARSEELRALIKSLDAAGRNTTDGISLARTAESALGGVNESLGRMRELAVQSANGTLSDSDRASIQSEFNQLSEEIDRISGSTEFNGVSLLDGSQARVSIQTGSDAGDRVEIGLAGTGTGDLGLDDQDLSSAAGAMTALESIDAAIDAVSGARAAFGSVENQLASNFRSIGQARDELYAADSRIRDIDYAREAARLAQASIIQLGGASLYTQSSVSSIAAAQLLDG